MDKVIQKQLALLKFAILPGILGGIFLYFNKEDKQPLVMQEMTALTDFVSELPESIYVIWAVYPDESIKDEEIKVTILAAGKELENG